jgi:hypothetical protein
MNGNIVETKQMKNNVDVKKAKDEPNTTCNATRRLKYYK